MFLPAGKSMNSLVRTYSSNNNRTRRLGGMPTEVTWNLLMKRISVNNGILEQVLRLSKFAQYTPILSKTHINFECLIFIKLISPFSLIEKVLYGFHIFYCRPSCITTLFWFQKNVQTSHTTTSLLVRWILPNLSNTLTRIQCQNAVRLRNGIVKSKKRTEINKYLLFTHSCTLLTIMVMSESAQWGCTSNKVYEE